MLGEDLHQVGDHIIAKGANVSGATQSGLRTCRYIEPSPPRLEASSRHEQQAVKQEAFLLADHSMLDRANT